MVPNKKALMGKTLKLINIRRTFNRHLRVLQNDYNQEKIMPIIILKLFKLALPEEKPSKIPLALWKVLKIFDSFKIHVNMKLFEVYEYTVKTTIWRSMQFLQKHGVSALFISHFHLLALAQSTHSKAFHIILEQSLFLVSTFFMEIILCKRLNIIQFIEIQFVTIEF